MERDVLGGRLMPFHRIVDQVHVYTADEWYREDLNFNIVMCDSELSAT